MPRVTARLRDVLTTGTARAGWRVSTRGAGTPPTTTTTTCGPAPGGGQLDISTHIYNIYTYLPYLHDQGQRVRGPEDGGDVLPGPGQVTLSIYNLSPVLTVSPGPWSGGGASRP